MNIILISSMSDKKLVKSSSAVITIPQEQANGSLFNQEDCGLAIFVKNNRNNLLNGGGREWQWCRVSYVTGASN